MPVPWPHAPPSPPAARGHHHVPVVAAPFFGREDLVTTVRAALESPGLLTLTGPGGSGKTRLAAHLAAEARDRGVPVWWADLQSARSTADFEREVAWAVGGAQSRSDPGVRLAAEGEAWLVLDNVEQLPPEIQTQIEGWLAVAPEARILVTSRAALAHLAERVVVVPPLPIPEEAQAFEGPAWALLEHHAPAGTLAEAAPADVVRVLRAVDGLPLAIQLAAGRLEVMSLPMLARRLDGVLDVFADPGQRGRRHGSLRDVAQWSWELLSARERDALTQLSVFRGPFSLDAAEAVLDLGDEQVLDAIHNLLRRHLVVRDGDWLRLLEVVRAFAEERRDDHGGDGALLERHAGWVVGTMDLELPDVVDEAWFSRAMRPLPEAYAVLERAERQQLGATWAHTVWRRALIVVRHRRANRELAEVAERLLALPDADAGQRARQYLARSVHRKLAGDRVGSGEDIDRAERLAVQAEDRQALCQVHLNRGLWFYGAGDHAAADPHLERAAQLATELGAWRVVVQYKLCHSVYLAKGPPENRDDREIRRLLLDAVAMAEGRDVGIWVNALVFAAGGISNMGGATQEAYDLFLRARDAARPIHAIADLAGIEGGLGDTAGILGDLEAAAEHLKAAWQTYEQLGRAQSAAYHRGFYGRTLVRQGETERGIHHMTEALAARERVGGKPYHWNTIQKCLDLATASDPSTWEAPTESEDVRRLRQAHRAMAEGAVSEAREHLAALEAMPKVERTDLMRVDMVARLRRQVETWHIARDGSCFQPPTGERCTPGTNPANARILAHLAAQRVANPGQPSSADVLFEVGWPGERAVTQAQQNRVRVALSGLREAGLRELLIRAGREGWCLDPHAPVMISE